VVEEAELLEHNFSALEAFGAFILVEFLFQVGFDFGLAGDLALYVALDGQAGLLRGKLEEFVDEGEEFFCLLGVMWVGASLPAAWGLEDWAGGCGAGAGTSVRWRLMPRS